MPRPVSKRSSELGSGQRERDLARRTLEREEKGIHLEEEMATLKRKMDELRAKQEELKAKRARLWKEQEFDERRSQLEREEDAASQALPLSDEEEEEEEEEEESQIAARPPVAKAKKGVKKNKEKQEQMARWVNNCSRQRPAETEGVERASVGEIATSTGTAVAKATVDRARSDQPGAGNPSLLELVKLLERRRPQKKFNGQTKDIDFVDHMCRFERAVNLP